MKNKRTKLTAILLSALMAVSTISSVTWAADLFSDGSDDSEVVIEDSIDTVSDVEEEVEAENLPLTGVTADAIQSVIFKYDTDDISKVSASTKVIAVFTLNYNGKTWTENVDAIKGTPVAATCYLPEYAVYSAPFSVDDKNITVYSVDKYVDGTTGTVDVADICNDLSYKTDVVQKGYIVTPGSNTKTGIIGHKRGNDPVTTVIESATCEKIGWKITYYACEGCKILVDENNNDVLNLGSKTSYNLQEELIKALKGSDTNGDGKVDYDEVPETEHDYGSAGRDIWKETIPLNKHNYDEDHPIILKDTDFLYEYNGIPESQSSSGPTHRYCVEYGEAYDLSSSFVQSIIFENGDSPLKYAPLNCIYNPSTGEMEIANSENGRDSYYYSVDKCINCNKVVKIHDKYYLKDTSNKVKGDYYEEVEGGNVIGFLAKDSTNGAQPLSSVFSFAQYGTILYYLPIDADQDLRVSAKTPNLVTPLVPVLQNCTKNGYYYIRTYVEDTPEAVHTEKVTVDRLKQSHVYGSIEVLPSKTKINGVASTVTEDDKLLTAKLEQRTSYSQFEKDISNGFIVVRGDGINVTEAKSINCITEAKYELYHQCVICGKVEKVETKTATYNTDRHQWSKWSYPDTDDADNKYYDLGDGTHKKFTYYNRTCDLCGLRDLKLANEFVEAHKLVETKYDDEGEDDTYVAPTCGEDGHYDVILRCACGYEDKESRKQASIPATDKHDFGDNPAEIQIIGEIQVGGRGVTGEPETGVTSHIIYAQIVRKCNVCNKYDSNGINNTQSGSTGSVGVNNEPLSHIGPTVILDTSVEGRSFTDYKEPKKDQATGVAYPCSTGWITVNFNWAGKVDGETTKLSDTKTVPYYPNEATFAGSRAHQADDVRIEGKVDATTEAPGHYDRVVYCSVCGDEVSRETIEIAQIGSAPSIKATPANYNTINISWDAVEGADHYRLYYKSSDVGVTTWKLVRTVNGTSFTHSGLVTGAKYRYTVRAVLNGVNGEYDRKGSVAIPKLAAPENVAVTAVSGKNKVSWSKVDGANGYIIQRSTGSGWTRVGSVKKGAKVTWIDKKPVSGATYRVRAYRTVNDANFSKNNVYSAFSAAK